MLFPKLFGGKASGHVGIDIGTASVKVVELAKSGNEIVLKAYGELQAFGYLRRIQESAQLSSLKMLEGEVAELISEVLSAAEFKTSALEILRENLERIRHTDQQARLAREARVLNVQDAFRVNDSNAIAGRNILLVDDVITTGATMAWAASALKKAGAREVWACAVAQG